jgi:hypothetical protein
MAQPAFALPPKGKGCWAPGIAAAFIVDILFSQYKNPLLKR